MLAVWYFFSRTQQQAESFGETPHLKPFIYWPNLFQHNAELGWQGLTDIYGVRVPSSAMLDGFRSHQVMGAQVIIPKKVLIFLGKTHGILSGWWF